jgi:hypothetical protein
MTSKRTFYRTVLKVEILSETPYNETSLEQVAYDINEGDQVGKITTEISSEELNGKEAAAALSDAGSEPEFFMLDKNGNDVFDEEDEDDDDDDGIRKMRE